MSTPGFVTGAWDWFTTTFRGSGLHLPVPQSSPTVEQTSKPVPATPHQEAIESDGTVSGWLENLVLNVLKVGRVPKHVAFIMDGNRRYARKRGMPVEEGHRSGFTTLVRTLEYCAVLGVKTVTVYAFSIENFKRPQNEVDFLMRLSANVFDKLEERAATIKRHQVRVRIIGNLALLPIEVQRAAYNVMEATKHYNKMTFNICFSYTSSEEVERAFRNAKYLIRDSPNSYELDDLNENFLSACMYTRGDHPDLLIRTSGESRLSDFLTWQCKHTHLKFVKENWPQLSWWQVVLAILDYQVNGKEERPQTAKASQSVCDKVALELEKLEYDRLRSALSIGSGN